MEENLVDQYSERIEVLKNAISKAQATLEVRETEKNSLKVEYANLEKDCKEKYNISLKNLSKEISDKEALVLEKLEEAESKYKSLTDPKNESE
jgi:hypothetical protein